MGGMGPQITVGSKALEGGLGILVVLLLLVLNELGWTVQQLPPSHHPVLGSPSAPSPLGLQSIGSVAFLQINMSIQRYVHKSIFSHIVPKFYGFLFVEAG